MKPKRVFKVRRLTPIERFFKHVDKTEGCWVWKGSKWKDYGCFRIDGKSVKAHRFAYESLVGPIPEGMQLDHLCRNRSCIRPDHLEPVTNLENTLRGENFIARHIAKTHCAHGHSLSGDNLRIEIVNGGKRRVCRTCNRERAIVWRIRHSKK